MKILALIVMLLLVSPVPALADEFWWWLDAEGKMHASNCPTRYINEEGVPQLENIGGKRKTIWRGQAYAGQMDLDEYLEKHKGWRDGLISIAVQGGQTF
jgi:hypothetical protein